MKISTLHRQETGFFSQQQLDLCYDQSVYSDFLTQSFSKEAFGDQIQRKKKSFSKESRKTLVNALKKQYENITTHPTVLQNIESLINENTFTVVTGHQLVAMTGPLYFIYKIAHVIRSTEELKKIYPEYNFVPIFWMATEDHDYDEIKSFHLFNKTITWETKQSGPVGRFELKDWETVKEQLTDLFKNHPDSEIFELLNIFDDNNYAEAFRKLINHLVGKYGVVIINGDDTSLKREFSPYMIKDVKEQFSFKAITKTSEKLTQLGGKQQIVPREINLFYIENGIRERLIDNNTTIEISGKGTYSKDQILSWIEQNPENFSPNVSLRPLYQEVILPNLSYIGGAGEINYWLQLKGVFDAAEIPFPLLQTRNSVLWIDKNSSDKMEKVNLSIKDLFKELHILNKQYLEENAEDEIDFSELDHHMEILKQQIITTTTSIDTALEAYAAAESVRMEKQLTQIKERLYKTVKGKHDKNLKIIQQLKEKLFPEGGLQERYTNFFQLSPDGNYSETLHSIIENMQPFNSDFIVMEE
jgi:bacillithiol biosynthesis cysteine-adding enzyme BshC